MRVFMMVLNIDNIERKQDKIFKDMELEDIHQYIDNFAREYYKTLILNDKAKFNAMEVNLNKVLSIHKDKNLDLYILYALSNAFNEILNNSVNNDLDLNLVKIPRPKTYENNNKFFVPKTKLDNVIQYIRDKQIAKETKNFYDENPCYNDFLELFNYKDYLL